ncbi:dihydrodipicolinate synthase family protein [Plastoroseomonas hellenica]|uniref:dihydrodipicolinate synthase family protein n=1 Tax=Plastoroseomonas hellenica TaxID=2687306 RepID=UPI0020137AB3|nr:dihydrodipicolinate synthase family protein [Plastoroseomonas hellenica]MBR0646117.1 dihydrodipicolinate synthase family protein [Plastoroseomonas hellenica]
MSAAPMFRGLSAFPITPADPHGRVDTEGLARLVQRLAAAKVDSIGLLGSTGTYAYLTRAERRRAIEAAAGCLGGRVPLIVGIGALRTDDAQDLARDAAAAGADGLLLAPVSYTPLTEEEVYQHFAAVAEATTLPLCIYNNPATTHFTFSDDLLARLAKLPGIAAAKNPAPPPAEARARHEALRTKVPDSFAIGYSGDWRAADAVLAGGDAWYSVVGGLLPMPSLQLLRAAQAGDTAAVARWDARFQGLWELFQELSSLRVMYAAADILGLCRTAPPQPILPLRPTAYERVAAALEKLNADARPGGALTAASSGSFP